MSKTPTGQKLSKPPRTRLSPEARERQILAAATEYFSEVGIDGQTRELATRLGVSQALIFKYFTSKEELLDRIYEDLYLTRWNPAWEETVVDRSKSIEERLVWFYNDYGSMILKQEWVRIFLHSGLRDADIHSRFLRLLQERIFVPLAAELRYAFGYPSTDECPLEDIETEMIWSSHSKVFYYGLRKWVYKSDMRVNIRDFIDVEVEMFVVGYRDLLRRILDKKVDLRANPPGRIRG